MDGKFKPQLVALQILETVTDKRIFAFTNYGNCHKLDIYDPDLECKLSDDGVTLKDLSKDAEQGEKVVALFEVGEHMPYGNLLFFTKKGMIKKTEWAEYEQRKESFQAVKLGEEDEVIAVEEDTSDEDTIIIVTKQGICLNAMKDDIPTQGRIATGVRGIMLRDGDEVVFVEQIQQIGGESEGEIIIATSDGKFKRVILGLIEPSKRYRKGSTIVGLRDGETVITASYVTVPYKLAVVDNTGAVSELLSEDIRIQSPSNRAQKMLQYKEGTVKTVIPMPYKKEE